MGKDLEKATIDELRELVRSLWWTLDMMAVVDLCHRGNDTTFRNSLMELLQLREDFGLYSNDGKTLEYDPNRHAKDMTTGRFFVVRPDGDMYPDDDVKRSEMVKETLDSRGVVGDCDCASCRRCASAMWRVYDSLSVSIRELTERNSAHCTVMANVMERIQTSLQALANPEVSTMAIGAAELSAASTYIQGMAVARAHKIAEMIDKRSSMPNALKNLRSDMRVVQLSRQDIAALPDQIKASIRKSIIEDGMAIPPELMTEEEKKTFH
jgi:ribosomal protein S13